jgi:hypothetical protein
MVLWDDVCYGQGPAQVRNYLMPIPVPLYPSPFFRHSFQIQIIYVPNHMKASYVHITSNLIHLDIYVFLVEVRLFQLDAAQNLSQMRLLEAFALLANSHEQRAQHRHW